MFAWRYKYNKTQIERKKTLLMCCNTMVRQLLLQHKGKFNVILRYSALLVIDGVFEKLNTLSTTYTLDGQA